MSSFSGEHYNIHKLIAPEFKPPDEAKDALASILRSVAQNGLEKNIVIDASGMPRHLIFDILKLIAEQRPDFAGIHLTYTHPTQYLPGQLEIPSPCMPLLYPSPSLQHADSVSLVLFPGFNTAESLAVLVRIYDPSKPGRAVSVYWVFVHSGSQYAYFEKAWGEHVVFREHLREMTHDHKICRMDHFSQITQHIVDLSANVRNGEVLVMAGLGPRIISVPIFLATLALRNAGRQVNVLVPRPLYYSSLRSKGERPQSSSWDLCGEYTELRARMSGK